MSIKDQLLVLKCLLHMYLLFALLLYAIASNLKMLFEFYPIFFMIHMIFKSYWHKLYVFHEICPFFHTEVTVASCKINEKIFKDLGRTAKFIGLDADENYEMRNCTIFIIGMYKWKSKPCIFISKIIVNNDF